MERKTYSYNGVDIFTYANCIGTDKIMNYFDCEFLLSSLKQYDTDNYVVITVNRINNGKSNFAIKNGNTDLIVYQKLLEEVK